MSFSGETFEMMMARLPVDMDGAEAIAVGVSGGPDSMALCHLLSRWAQGRGVQVHAITVDHQLRTESAQEARSVGAIVSSWTHVGHHILTWDGEKPEARILEEARAARYALIENHMKEHGIRHLFIAHHQGDQAETFLIRLAKGSGLDGLAAMLPVQEKAGGIFLCRPLLGASKDDLIAYCREQGIGFVEDPTNENEKYLRPRLRAARDVLEEEGLSDKRLSVTAARMARARGALEQLARDVFDRAVIAQTGDELTLDWKIVSAAPEELVLRVLMQAAAILQPARDYAPRMERMEQLLFRLLHEDGFKSASLSGCVFALKPKEGTLWVRKEE